MNTSDAENADSRWSWLYKIGGAAALLGVPFISIQFLVFIIWPPPDTAIGWFTLFQNKKLGGLLAFELLFPVNAALGIATTLALYVALRRVNESLMAIAMAPLTPRRFCAIGALFSLVFIVQKAVPAEKQRRPITGRSSGDSGVMSCPRQPSHLEQAVCLEVHVRHLASGLLPRLQRCERLRAARDG